MKIDANNDYKFCNIIIENEVMTKILGLSDSHYDYFWRKYGKLAKGYFFNPTYKMGRWDGQIRFFKKNGETYTYFLEEILIELINFGYKPKVTDKRKPITVKPELLTADLFKDYGVTLRDYQVEGCNNLLIEGNGLCVAATGAGKTTMIAALVAQYTKINLKCLVIVPNLDLIGQTVKEFESLGIDVGSYSGSSKDLTHPHVVSTWQSLKNTPHIVAHYQVVIVDETHQAAATQLQKLLSDNAKDITYRFGFTGTMPKDDADNLTIRGMLGDIRFKIMGKALMDDGHLANISIQIIQLNEDLKKAHAVFKKENELDINYRQFKKEYFPDYSSEKDYLNKKQGRIDFVADFILRIQEKSDKSNMLVLVDSIKHGNALQKVIPGSVFIHGNHKSKDRQQQYSEFEDADNLIVIATVHIAGTGINIKRLFNLVLINAGKSYARTIQSIGRSMRKASDKDSAMIYDICSDLKYSNKHMNERIKFYQEHQYKYSKIVMDYE